MADYKIQVFRTRISILYLLTWTRFEGKALWKQMAKGSSILVRLSGGRWIGSHRPILMLVILAILVSIATLSKFYSITSLSISDTFCNRRVVATVETHNSGFTAGDAHSQAFLQTVVQKIRNEMNETTTMPSVPSSRYNAFLGDILDLLVQGSERETQSHPLATRPNHHSGGDDQAAAEFFLIEEIRKYVRIKPNRLGKQNFMGANGTFTSIGHACFAMKNDLEEYMDYDVGEICKDDWKLAQRLMVHGCDPLPRRRCLSRAPQLYTRPFSIEESLWKLPDDRNVRWSGYRCKNFTCLAANGTRKGFFKCADCFNLTHHEMPRWMEVQLDPHTNLTADFLIPDVLAIKPGEIRVGLDFSVGTGTFAARMREFNVTVASGTINLGAPFNEMIALRGLLPIYLSINQRLPFFDNTLDLIHTTRFLDGWIDFVLLDFILYDWDRVLRPGGLLWIDSFFCLKDELDDYLESFKMLRYRKRKWVVVPKIDKDDREVFFSAVLEKPPRPF